ncbi:MAG: hypothetical protein H6898_14920 [Rhodobacter sp.]|nr:hypothetical protein [Rhodobacter sp.]
MRQEHRRGQWQRAIGASGKIGAENVRADMQVVAQRHTGDAAGFIGRRRGRAKALAAGGAGPRGKAMLRQAHQRCVMQPHRHRVQRLAKEPLGQIGLVRGQGAAAGGQQKQQQGEGPAHPLSQWRNLFCVKGFLARHS